MAAASLRNRPRRDGFPKRGLPAREEPMIVSEAMTAQVVTAKPTDTIKRVAKIMQEVDTGVVPVSDNGKVVGLITDRDIVLRVVAEGGDLNGPVSAAMSED